MRGWRSLRCCPNVMLGGHAVSQIWRWLAFVLILTSAVNVPIEASQKGERYPWTGDTAAAVGKYLAVKAEPASVDTAKIEDPLAARWGAAGIAPAAIRVGVMPATAKAWVGDLSDEWMRRPDIRNTLPRIKFDSLESGSQPLLVPPQPRKLYWRTVRPQSQWGEIQVAGLESGNQLLVLRAGSRERLSLVSPWGEICAVDYDINHSDSFQKAFRDLDKRIASFEWLNREYFPAALPSSNLAMRAQNVAEFQHQSFNVATSLLTFVPLGGAGSAALNVIESHLEAPWWESTGIARPGDTAALWSKDVSTLSNTTAGLSAGSKTVLAKVSMGVGVVSSGVQALQYRSRFSILKQRIGEERQQVLIKRDIALGIGHDLKAEVDGLLRSRYALSCIKKGTSPLPTFSLLQPDLRLSTVGTEMSNLADNNLQFNNALDTSLSQGIGGTSSIIAGTDSYRAMDTSEFANFYLSGASTRQEYISSSLDLFEMGYQPTNDTWTEWSRTQSGLDMLDLTGYGTSGLLGHGTSGLLGYDTLGLSGHGTLGLSGYGTLGLSGHDTLRSSGYGILDSYRYGGTGIIGGSYTSRSSGSLGIMNDLERIRRERDQFRLHQQLYGW